MITKLIIIAPVSAVVVDWLLTEIVNVPLVTVTTFTIVVPATPAAEDEPERCVRRITSPIATAEFVTTNSALASAAKEVVIVVIVPDRHGFGDMVTPVERSVPCVAVPPAPVA